MATNPFKNFFHPGARGRLRWVIFGIFILFVATFFIDVIGFKNIVANKLDDTISAVPVINSLKVWPKIEVTADNSKQLQFKNIKEIDLTNYGPSFSLGLDLQGGTHLVYNADVSKIDSGERDEALNGVKDVIERRVNAMGISEPLVQTNKEGNNWRVIVELAGITDVNKAIEMIGETPLLEFKEEGATPTLTAEQQKLIDQQNQEIKVKAESVLKEVISGADFAELAKKNSEDPGSKENGGLISGAKKGSFVSEFDDVVFSKLKDSETYPQLVQTKFGYHIIRREKSTGTGDDLAVDVRHILIKTKTAADLGINTDQEWISTKLTGQHLTKATVEFDGNSGIPQVSLEFNKEGSELFAQITEKNVGKLVAIFLDGEPISIPKVEQPILSGKAVISGNFTIKEAKLLAQRLNAGALPVPISLVSQTTVGATLGNKSIEQSLVAGVWGLLLVALFMLAFYRFPGLISIVALLIYTAITLALFKLLGVTLTLAGIAGFILSIGMAVDANVLIFERLKEELRQGKNLSLAVDEGFHRAWTSIRDSNVSSLITCAVLFFFGTSIIKGFAFTLALGIFVSMFSAITITREFLKLVVKWKISDHKWLYGAKLFAPIKNKE